MIKIKAQTAYPIMVSGSWLAGLVEKIPSFPVETRKMPGSPAGQTQRMKNSLDDLPGISFGRIGGDRFEYFLGRFHFVSGGLGLFRAGIRFGL